jgi:High potential iron-sulfur protein
MSSIDRLARRRLVRNLTLSIPFLSLALSRPDRAPAADAPLLSPDAPEAKAVKYVEDATKAQGAIKGSTCANCGLYQGRSGLPTGPCQIFPGKQVKAAGWCSSWAPQM